jgi:hypothetical protein
MYLNRAERTVIRGCHATIVCRDRDPVAARANGAPNHADS